MGRRNGRKSYFAREHKKPKQKKQSYYKQQSASTNQNRKQRQFNVTAESIFAIADDVFGGTIYRHSSGSPD